MHERIRTAQAALASLYGALEVAREMAEPKEQQRALNDVAKLLRQLAFNIDGSATKPVRPDE